ncbi:MAG: hypothetical protein K0R41_3570, partial [Geminicoccaceae bacterium]|nr:hypothetical protein [Geminicoccaceae bacterium]
MSNAQAPGVAAPAPPRAPRHEHRARAGVEGTGAAPGRRKPLAGAARPASAPRAETAGRKVEVRRLSFWYGDFQALKDISIPIGECEV